MSRYVSRRAFLASSVVAVASSGLPVLSSLRPAHAQDEYPKRFVFVFNPNGTIGDSFWPTVGSGGVGDMSFPEITAPLAPLKDKLLFLKGVDLSVTETGPGGPHQRGMGSLLTGRELLEGSFVGGDGSLAGWANGVSIDQVIAEQLGRSSLLPSLELGVRATDAEVRSRISYAGPANPLPPINSPLAAYERVFAGITAATPELQQRRQQVADTLHLLYAEIRPRLSSVDREKADAHLELVRGIERRLGANVDISRCVTPEAPPLLDEDSEETMPMVSDLQVDLAAAALACDITRVVTLQFSTAINAIALPWIEYTSVLGTVTPSTGSGHNLSHAGASDADAQAQLLLRSTWYAERIGRLLETMDSVAEGEGTLLDHSAVLWGNELSIGFSHSLNGVPFMLAGSADGYFSTGRVVDYGGVPHNGLLIALLQSMGLDIDHFGHPDYSDGPLPELT